MAATRKLLMTLEEYFQLEESSEIRHEYYHGRIFAMVGASKKHNILSLNVAGEFRNQLRHRSCLAFMSDMRVGSRRFLHLS